MSTIRHALRRDDGSASLVELMVASSMSLLILGLLGTLIISVFRTDTYTDEDNRALAALRTTSDRMVKELRQARKIYIESFYCGDMNRMIHFWIDANNDDRQGLAERITWRIEPTAGGKAHLTRKTEEPTSQAIVYTDDLLWEETRKYFDYNVVVSCVPVDTDPLSHPDPTTVTVSLVGDVDPAKYATSRQIHSEVKLRNVPD